MSIRQLEINLGYSNGYLAKWKNNTPNSNELSRIADYFNVSVDYLLGREVKYKKKSAFDLKEDDVVFSLDGNPISKETMRKAIAILQALESEENKDKK